jgi:hypothetical protein
MNHYALSAIAASDHFEVSSGAEPLGRLYLFEVTEPELLAQGIEKQWFLTHQQTGEVVSGHVNQDGGWSLSQPRSLQPTQPYVSQGELLAKVFSPDYVEQEGQAAKSLSPTSEVPEIETARQQLEQQLALLLMEGERQQLLDFQSVDPHSLWQLEKEGEVLSLRDRTDDHRVLSVKEGGEILSRLSLEDAQALWEAQPVPSQSAKTEKSNDLEIE